MLEPRSDLPHRGENQVRDALVYLLVDRLRVSPLCLSAPFGHGRTDVVIGCIRRCVLDTRRRDDGVVRGSWSELCSAATLLTDQESVGRGGDALLDASCIDSFALDGA